MPKPAPPPGALASALAALRTAYPAWRLFQTEDESWIGVKAPLDAPDHLLLTGHYTAVKASTLPALAAGVRDLHATRWEPAP